VARAPGQGLEPRVAVGKCQTPAGTLLAREAPGQAWAVVVADDSVHSRDLLLALPGVRAEVQSSAGDVRLTLWGNLPELSEFPALESAVVLHDSRAFDLDFTLDRGRVVLANRKKKGPAAVWVRLPTTAWSLTLSEPGDEVALELMGRWQRGVLFQREARAGHRPTQVVAVHMLKGSATLKTGRVTHRLSAPPGPASFEWDSVRGEDEGPSRRDELPAWAGEEVPQGLRGLLSQLVALRDESVPAALATFLRQADRHADAKAATQRRRLAVYALGAVDDLEGLIDAWTDSTDAAAREAAVDTLRHWIGRDASRDGRLFRFLVQRREYTEPQAETVLHLLHSPFLADQPETYETLIAYLRHSRLPVRELARWHLYRLAPAGRSIAYDAAAPEAERLKALEAWKKLIPSGKLPPVKP
jgi:hypothetical protein